MSVPELDDIHLDLRAVLVGHIAQQRAIEMNDLTGIAECLDLGPHGRDH